VKNSIVSGNGNPALGDANCNQAYPPPTYIDFVDQGNNVTWNDTTCPGKVADPLLGPLGDHGGLTQTLLPGSGGAAIGAVPSGSCSVANDQRGLPRPGAGKSACDAGAVETTSGEGPGGGGEENGGEQPGGGGNPPGGSAPGGSTGTPVTQTPEPLKCRKGFKKKNVKGKLRCVKVKKPHRRRHHKH
jgi:hypothetical protein